MKDEEYLEAMQSLVPWIKAHKIRFGIKSSFYTTFIPLFKVTKTT